MEGMTSQYFSTQSHINGEARQIFEESGPVVKYGKGDIIYYQGDTPSCFYYLKKGRVRVFITSADGLEKTLSTANHGEILGEASFFEQKPRVSCAAALTNVELVAIDLSKLVSLIRSKPQIALELLSMQAARVRLLSTQIDSITFLSAEERIAQLLIENIQPNMEKSMVKLTHEEIGNIVGASRVTVSKILNKFAKKGYIKTSYRSIIIIDSMGLRSIGENML